MNTESCDMRRVEKPVDLWDCEALDVGDFYFHTEDDGQRFFTAMLPAHHIVRIPVRPIRPGRETVNGGHSWEWDGNETAPDADALDQLRRYVARIR